MVDLEWYGCRRCGAFTEVNDLKEVLNPDYMITTGDRYKYVCPECGLADLDDADQCACGAVFFYGESERGICPKCAEEARKNLPLLREFYDDRKSKRNEIMLNPLFTDFFDEKEIDEILFKAFCEKVADDSEYAEAFVQDCIEQDGAEIAELMQYQKDTAKEATA